LAERRRLAAPLAWAGAATLMGLAALALNRVDPTAIDWQPVLATHEPWRAWSAVFVHYSGLHLAANLAGAVLVGALGAVARVPARSVAAWLVAWPLTQFGLALQPALVHYGGLSGVLHAGVAVVVVHLLCNGSTRERRIGLAIAAGLALKVVSESPWGAPLRHPPGWDIAVAPLAHASGALAGALCAGVAEALHRRSRLR
jgi:rhomboid family GlyGly-CTERM serine protease